MTRWPFLAGAAVIAIGVGLGVYAMKRAQAPVAGPATIATASETPTATTSVPAPSSPMIRSHKVKLIVPEDAGSPLPFRVFVDGNDTLIVQMGVYVEGPIGSTHQVRIVGKDKTVETTVVVNKWNVVPDAIDLTTPAPDASVKQKKAE